VTQKSQTQGPVSQSSLILTIVDRIQSVIEEAEDQTKPLEMNPHRTSLFELFVMADGAGLLEEDVEPNLTSDAIAAMLADRWQLRTAAMDTMQHEGQLPGDSLSKMRLLWSFLRMWMEWTYAWDRWAEFHDGESTTQLD
jgi:hypothetical protein